MEDSRPRPWPARAPTRRPSERSVECGVRRAPRNVLAKDSYALAHASGQHAQLVTILGNGAAGDLDTAFLQDVDDRLIGERVLGILFGDELLDLRLDAPRRDVFAAGRGETGGEKELERQH